MTATFRALATAVAITTIGAAVMQSAARQGSGASIGRHGLALGGAGLGAGRPAPAWKNTSWLNAERPVSLESLRGRVVLLNFWVFTCYNCTNTVPALVDLDRRYRDRGLTLIGIHTPEFPPYAGEHDRSNVARALARHGITYPVAQDNDHATWDLYGIRFWPSFTLIDRKGVIRYEGDGEFHPGDATDALWERRIEQLLAEACGPGDCEQAGEPLLRIETSRGPGGLHLTLEAPAGARINARLTPVLELPGGQVLRFAATTLTADSAYFASPPTLVLPGYGKPPHGLIRAGVCLEGESVCRTVRLAL